MRLYMAPEGKDGILDEYADAFASLTPESLDALMAMLDDEVHFSDPFNDVRGKAAFRAIFSHMFEVCDEPRFRIMDIARSGEGKSACAYIRWHMSGRIRKWPRTEIDIHGMSEVRVGAGGLVIEHLDHWDSASQLLARLPVIGTIMRPVLRMFATGATERRR